MIKFNCISCGENLEVPASLVGSDINCPRCLALLRVPPPEIAAAPVPDKDKSCRPLELLLVFIIGGLLGFAGGLFTIRSYKTELTQAYTQAYQELKDDLLYEIDMKDAYIAELEAKLNPAAQPSKQPNAAAAGEMVVGIWRGSGGKTTEKFRAESPWRLDYEITAQDPEFPTVLMISVHQGKNLISSASLDHPGADESYIYAAGEFFLSIASMSCNYTIKAVQIIKTP